jgi:hypothetical protein
MAFGGEVDDGADFPSVLERIVARPVLNAAVPGYGIDQTILRAERLLPVHRPDTLIVSLSPLAVELVAFSYYYTWKPFFTLVGDELVLHNVPVPRGERSIGRFKALAIRSQLAHQVFRRLAPDWWYLDGRRRGRMRGAEQRTGSNDVEIALHLMARIARVAREQQVRLMLVVLRTKHEDIGRLPLVVAGARELGIEVVDLVPGITRLARLRPRGPVFRPKGHLTASSNEWVASSLAGQLAETPRKGGSPGSAGS